MKPSGTRISSVALAVIGDEVLLGEVKDLNIYTVSREIYRLGADLSYACVLPDNQEFMTQQIQWMKEKFDWVVTTGGIGATHDDLTKQVVSDIVGRSLVEAPETIKALEKRLGSPLPEKARELALVPEGARLVTNEMTAAPGFMIENLLVLPGIPSLVAGMIGELEKELTGKPFHAEAIRTMLRESELADHLYALQNEFPMVKVGSYPQMGAVDHRVKIVLRSREPESLRKAVQSLLKRIE